MASFVAKHVARHIAAKAGCSEESSPHTLEAIARYSTAIVDGAVGAMADRIARRKKKIKDYEHHFAEWLVDMRRLYDSDGDETVEVEAVDSEGRHKELASIQPFLEMAKAAYSNKSMAGKVESVLRSELIHRLKEPTKLCGRLITTDTEVHVCILEDGTLAFAFRGTESLLDLKWPLGDVLTDLKHDQVSLEHYDASNKVEYEAPASVKVHKGFKLAFQDVTRTPRPNENLRLVAAGLGITKADVKRVVCLGHSLGGALATLCAHWCRYVAYPDAQIWCVTVGSPRVGNQEFASDFNENVTQGQYSYRLVNKGDVVPSIPHPEKHHMKKLLPEKLLEKCPPYKHVEGQIYLCKHVTSKGTVFLKRGGRRPPLRLPSVKDHEIDAYIKSVKKLLAAVVHSVPS